NFSSTETFFDLYPRNPHAIKIIYHSIQIIFIKLLGYNIFSVRLISVIFGSLILYYFYKLCNEIFNSSIKSTIATTFLAIDIQFIYASHFARQEIVVLFVFIYALYFTYKNIDNHTIKQDLILGCIIGISIGVHPNSFIISLPFIAIYLYHMLFSKKLKLFNLMTYCLMLLVFCALFVLLSLSFNPNFINDYFNYGKQFKVHYSLLGKISEFKYFYEKLYYGISGTYYTPNIKFQFFIFISSFIITILKLFITKDKIKSQKIISVLLSIVFLNIGIILIGRYNQTSIIFQFPLFYILITYLLENLSTYYKYITTLVLALLILINTITNISPYISGDYTNYLNNISKTVEKDDIVLANLNSEFYFHNGKLHDYRNLAFLKENNMTFKDYIYKYNIKYIIYPEEMDVINSESPRWDAFYGNLYYYDEMKQFLKSNCTLVNEFRNKAYGIRIARYINEKDWTIKIYKVNY
ncbi:MAG: glycosyltransferase family 39 protein, partial [Clostridiaceae bacterium]|nr:glycosyltransferase family 39 protein [Clostridiaceae bacterium]